MYFIFLTVFWMHTLQCHECEGVSLYLFFNLISRNEIIVCKFHKVTALIFFFSKKINRYMVRCCFEATITQHPVRQCELTQLPGHLSPGDVRSTVGHSKTDWGAVSLIETSLPPPSFTSSWRALLPKSLPGWDFKLCIISHFSLSLTSFFHSQWFTFSSLRKFESSLMNLAVSSTFSLEALLSFKVQILNQLPNAKGKILQLCNVSWVLAKIALWCLTKVTYKQHS